MRAIEDSRLSIRLPFSCALARTSSSVVTGTSFRLRNARSTDCTTLGADSFDVPAYTARQPLSRYGFSSLKIEYTSPCFSRTFWNRRELIPPPSSVFNTKEAYRFWCEIEYDGTPMQSCTCSSDFLFRIEILAVGLGAMSRNSLLPAGRWANLRVANSRNSSCCRLPAAATTMFPAWKRCR